MIVVKPNDADYIASNPTQLATTTISLVAEIKRLAADSKTGKVTIVAHSNGGLVAKEVMLAAGVLVILLSTWWAVAQPPAGFIEKADSKVVRPSWTASQIRSFLPARGRFTFPAPYNTEGIRLTNATDCGGGDCVQSFGLRDGRNINNHRGRDTTARVLVVP